MSKLRGFKFVATLVLVLKKMDSENWTKYDKFYSHSNAEAIINESDIDDIWINLYYSYIKHTKNFRKKLRLDLMFQSTIP